MFTLTVQLPNRNGLPEAVMVEAHSGKVAGLDKEDR
jgi:hypothetical protein